ncbi:hypothetical protein E2562_013180 [Oryza meyeriana var. granulata]|uniref:Gnk2-homologous domain-containing protein n=1 Tax=Oryza meyeriana var. granulata TaxID=110450 RepID=A0A6G1DID1_9ORYZ|nr:hypothetical protein E2562_013180 [Oryza meyeriana var. granulata]
MEETSRCLSQVYAGHLFPLSSATHLSKSNVFALLDALPSAAGPTGFASLSRGDGGDHAFVRGNSTPDDCATYLRSAVLDINGHCNANRRAAIWYDKCFLSYADTNASTADEDAYCQELYNYKNVSDKVGFGRTYYALVSRLRSRAVNDSAARMFARGRGRVVRPRRPQRDDRAGAVHEGPHAGGVRPLPSCCWGHLGGVVLGYNCYVRVEMYTYYYLNVDAPPPPLAPGPSTTTSTPSIG